MEKDTISVLGVVQEDVSSILITGREFIAPKISVTVDDRLHVKQFFKQCHPLDTMPVVDTEAQYTVVLKLRSKKATTSWGLRLGADISFLRTTDANGLQHDFGLPGSFSNYARGLGLEVEPKIKHAGADGKDPFVPSPPKPNN